MMDTLRQDITYATRALKRSPLFTAIVILTLAIGIGAVTAVFSVVDAVVLRPLPYHEPDRIVQVWSGYTAQPHGPTSPANFLDWRSASRSFESAAAENFEWFNLAGISGETMPERLSGALVSPSFFRTIGVQPVLGRAFATDEERPGARVAILSHALWTSRFSGDSAIVGRTITLNDASHEVLGVMPAGFDFPGQLIRRGIDLWVPLGWAPGEAQRGIRELGITARLAPNVTVEEAQRDVDRVVRELAEQYPRENGRVVMRIVPLHEEMVGSTQPILLVLLGAVALVLLIACANVANLMLGRAQGRQKELALRIALGARRGRIVRQLLTEGMVLAIAGGTLGTLAAVWLVDVLVALGGDGLPRAPEIGMQWRVLAVALGLSVLTGLLFAIGPALSVSGGRAADALKATGRAITGDRKAGRFRGALVVTEIAMAMVLLVGAGLLLRSLDRLLEVKPGFDPQPILAVRVSLPPTRYTTNEQRARFVAQGVERIGALPGVDRAAAIDYLPFGGADADYSITIDGYQPAPAEAPTAHHRAITSEYFDAMRIPMKAGRAITSADREGTELVTVVNEGMVRRYWPGATLTDVLGRRVRLGRADEPSPWLTIVGVVGDVKHWSLEEESASALYVPFAQSPGEQFSFVARSEGGVATLGTRVRETLLTIDPNQPVVIQPMTSLVDASVARPRFRSVLLGAFATVALLLAVIGIYGVISFGVTQRVREIGIRLALGAHRTDIVALVLRQGLVLTGIGVAIGIIGALSLTRLLQEMLFGITTTDVATFAGVSGLLVITAMIASYIPAHRAARVDPMVTMRGE